MTKEPRSAAKDPARKTMLCHPNGVPGQLLTESKPNQAWFFASQPGLAKKHDVKPNASPMQNISFSFISMLAFALPTLVSVHRSGKSWVLPNISSFHEHPSTLNTAPVLTCIRNIEDPPYLWNNSCRMQGAKLGNLRCET